MSRSLRRHGGVEADEHAATGRSCVFRQSDWDNCAFLQAGPEHFGKLCIAIHGGQHVPVCLNKLFLVEFF